MSNAQRIIDRELARISMTSKQWFNLAPASRRRLAEQRYCFGLQVDSDG